MKEKLKQEAIELYRQGKQIKEICNMIDLCDKTISKVLKENGIVIKTGPEYLRTHYFNDNYFEEINTADKAYFLGLLYADGNVYLKRNRVQITLAEEDSYILTEFAKRVGHNGRLYVDREFHKLIFDSKKMCQDLIKLGCVPRKSLILRFPTQEQVPDKILSHFIRGYFDGDGSIYFRSKNLQAKSVSFVSTKEFLMVLKTVLFQESIDSSDFLVRYKNKPDSAGEIRFGDKKGVKRFSEFIYKDCENLFLKRKKEKFSYEIS